MNKPLIYKSNAQRLIANAVDALEQLSLAKPGTALPLAVEIRRNVELAGIYVRTRKQERR